MMVDRQFRVVTYHDTWISIDPIRGCPYSCAYCVLRHAGTTGIRPEQVVSPLECVEKLLAYPLFIRGRTHLAIGNETDMFHPMNVDYLILLLTEISMAGIDNPISLISKAPLSQPVLEQIRAIPRLKVIFFLSYSGLGRRYEPNFSAHQLQENFRLTKAHGFPVIHYWRPLLPENTTVTAIRKMLEFASTSAAATVFVGLKLHPQLTDVLTKQGIVNVPEILSDKHGEWIAPEIVRIIYQEAKEICPNYPLYRHTACALACVLSRPNKTATVFRSDICPPSHCPPTQRQICQAAQKIPTEGKIAQTLSVLRRPIKFERYDDRVVILGEMTQEEFSFLLNDLNCPLQVTAIKMQGLYRGSILEGQRFIN